MDHTGHTTLAEWSAADAAGTDAAVAAFRAQLDEGYYAVVTAGEGEAHQVADLPVDAELVILRRPIAGGSRRGRSRRPPPCGGARGPTSATWPPSTGGGRRRPSPTSCRSSPSR